MQRPRFDNRPGLAGPATAAIWKVTPAVHGSASRRVPDPHPCGGVPVAHCSLVTTHKASLFSSPAAGPADPRTSRHGNVVDDSYRAVLANPPWAERLGEVPRPRLALPEDRRGDAKELNSYNSSDALLLNWLLLSGRGSSDFQAFAAVAADRPTRGRRGRPVSC